MPRPHPLCVRAVVACCLSIATVVPAAAQAPDPRPDAPGIIDIFKDTLTDFRRLPSTDAATWLSLGAAAASIGRAADGRTTETVAGARALDGLFAPGEMVGGARFQLAGALATYGVGRLTGHGKVAVVGADLIRANIVAQALTSGIKLSVRRGRPDGTRFSFPSGHTSVSFAAATVLQQHFGWAAGVPAYAGAAYVAASRIHERRHFLSDVAFGAVVGIVAGRTVTVGRGEYKFSVEPLATPGGAGVVFVRR